jgi:hypothetical protein
VQEHAGKQDDSVRLDHGRPALGLGNTVDCDFWRACNYDDNNDAHSKQESAVESEVGQQNEPNRTREERTRKRREEGEGRQKRKRRRRRRRNSERVDRFEQTGRRISAHENMARFANLINV